MPLQRCTRDGGCDFEEAGLVLDANWRWVHKVGGYSNCYVDGSWDAELCPDPETCQLNCAVEGVNAEGYQNTYGVLTEPDGIKLQFISEGGNVGSRLYMTDGNESYKMFQLMNKEFAMDVDVSTLHCGMNGAVYFVEMDALGGHDSAFNKAGAKFGTGYCDAQCPQEKFDWREGHGICCHEMDIWEANREAAAFTPHPCSTTGPEKCEGTSCGDGSKGERYQGVCDKDGCDMNAYRMGAQNFYGAGPEFDVDTTKPLTVVTQFITTNGTDDGDLFEIRQVYFQDGQIIPHANSTLSGVAGNSITDEFCNTQKRAFGDEDHHQAIGGLKKMGEALRRGMVLSVSLWDDFSTQMRWLDSTFPVGASPGTPGVQRGPCDGSTSGPAHVRQAHRDSFVTYTNIKYGETGSTFPNAIPRQLASTVHV